MNVVNKGMCRSLEYDPCPASSLPGLASIMNMGLAVIPETAMALLTASNVGQWNFICAGDILSVYYIYCMMVGTIY